MTKPVSDRALQAARETEIGCDKCVIVRPECRGCQIAIDVIARALDSFAEQEREACRQIACDVARLHADSYDTYGHAQAATAREAANEIALTIEARARGGQRGGLAVVSGIANERDAIKKRSDFLEGQRDGWRDRCFDYEDRLLELERDNTELRARYRDWEQLVEALLSRVGEFVEEEQGPYTHEITEWVETALAQWKGEP